MLGAKADRGRSCVYVLGARGEGVRGLLYMDVLHNYYITYICLCNQQICINNMLTLNESQNMFLLITSLIFNGFSILKSFGKLRLRPFKCNLQI